MLGQRGRRRPAGIDPAQATKLLSQGALLLDVSERDEWDAGHAPVARHVPLAELAGSMASLPPRHRSSSCAAPAGVRPRRLRCCSTPGSRH